MTTPVYVHRIIAECITGELIPEGLVIDHVDGNRTNNTPQNLRVVRPVENARNLTQTPRHNRSSRLIGVRYYVRTGRWSAQITVNNAQIHLGYFPTAADAREAYLQAKRKYHGIPQSNLDSKALVLQE